MIYFKNEKKDLGRDFIKISIPSSLSQLNGYYNTRKAIFCKEQGVFKNSDYDKKDSQAIPIVAVRHYMGIPDETVGVVRIYQESNRIWYGGRLGVIENYRTFSKFTCPNLFNEKKISVLYQMSIAAGLIFRAVSLANYLGCDKFYAHVQQQNVKLFQRLHWKTIKPINLFGISHFLMEADLDAYPAQPIYEHDKEAMKHHLLESFNVA